MKNTINQPDSELKYTVNKGAPQKHIMLWQLLTILRDNGFNLCPTDIEEKTIVEDYYDTRSMDLFKNGGFLKTRKVEMGETKNVEGSYKESSTSKGEVKVPLKRAGFKYLRKAMNETDADIDFDMIVATPVLNVTTERIQVFLEKRGVLVSLCLDEIVYTNYKLDCYPVYDGMLEIKAKDDSKILDEINSIFLPPTSISRQSPTQRPYKGYHRITPTKQSIYSRGINMTTELSQEMLPKEGTYNNSVPACKLYHFN